MRTIKKFNYWTLVCLFLIVAGFFIMFLPDRDIIDRFVGGISTGFGLGWLRRIYRDNVAQRMKVEVFQRVSVELDNYKKFVGYFGLEDMFFQYIKAKLEAKIPAKKVGAGSTNRKGGTSDSPIPNN